MLIKCAECNKDVSDSAPSCPHCGYILKATVLDATSKETAAIPQKKVAIFQFVSLGAIFIALFTPRILISLPCLVIISTGIIALVRKEPRWLLSLGSIIIGFFFISAATPNFGGDTASAPFTNNSNGTVTDNNTGLMWQKCSVGQNNDSTCSGTAASPYNWYRASGTYDATYNPTSQDVCGELTRGGYTDWRLPSKKELITIVDYSIPYPGPTINTTYFPNTIASFYWSSSTNTSGPNGAWYVYFYGGDVGGFYKFADFYVRCVRGGQ